MEPIDPERVTRGYMKTTKDTSKCIAVPMHKQTRRDFSKILRATDAYANIQRENENADYLKNLLGS